MELIDIAVFSFPNDAGVLESILSAENIPFVLNYQNSAIFIPGSGAVLSINKDDKEQVTQIIKEAGYERYLLES